MLITIKRHAWSHLLVRRCFPKACPIFSCLCSFCATHIKEYPWNVCVHDSSCSSPLPSPLSFARGCSPSAWQRQCHKKPWHRASRCRPRRWRGKEAYCRQSESEGKAGPGGHAENKPQTRHVLLISTTYAHE